jgi:protein-tyrosine-phosphatase
MMTSTILFLCPHHAAKSVIAEAYFNRLAQQKGLSWVAESAGTEPDEVVAPAVVGLLNAENIDVSRHQPRRVTADELQSAARIISMGCTSEELHVSPTRVEQWNIPAVSQNPKGASEAILSHIEALVAELK